MKLKNLFSLAVETGIDADPRGRKELERMLKKQKEKYAKLPEKEKEFADEERTWNPYSDSRIIAGTGEEEMKRMMVGIDIETPELLLADRLRERGEKIDGMLIHHPEGRALADLEKVLPMQADLLALLGVPVNQSDALLKPRMDKIWRAIHADNLLRVERAAELLHLPSMVCHTITDNLVWRFMEKNICAKKYDDLGEIMNAIQDIPEYRYYAKKGNPPIIVHGGRSTRPGKICATEFTGGTNGPEELIASQAQAGVGTIISMHVTEKSLEEAKKYHVNMIQCSHMASDTIGVNLLLDKFQKKDSKLSFVEASGFIRVERKS